MKNIVVCCDGTSNDISGAPTNVLRFYRSLVRSDEQLIYYDSGVGTLPDPSVLTDAGRVLASKVDMAVGKSVKDQACRAYRFLTRHWDEGDKIFLIGFSRGAYAVRALAGMLHAFGLVRRDLEHLDELGWVVYSAADFLACSNFWYAFSQPQKMKIHFVGVWDTVSSFGRMTSFKTLPYTADNPSIDHVRHAVAEDEKRTCFQPNIFRPKKDEQHTSFDQRRFAGSHGDVGGGYPEKEAGLSKVTLEWMYQEAAQLGCQLQQAQMDFYLGRTDSKTFQSKPDPDAKVHHSIQGFWHLLEFIPRRQWNHHADPERMSWYCPNLYRRRNFSKEEEYFRSWP